MTKFYETMFYRFSVLLVATTCLCIAVNAQSVPKAWYQLDLQQDSFYGISLSKAYSFLAQKNKTAKPVVVAVLDSGIDTAHEDLKTRLWRNQREIPGNGIDDDKNGYVDDVYGWNFLGNCDGQNMKQASDERSRVFHRWRSKFEGKDIATQVLNTVEQEEYKQWQKAKSELNFSQDEQVALMFAELTAKALKKHDKILRKEMGDEMFSVEKLEKFIPLNQLAKEAKIGYLTCIKMIGLDASESNTEIIAELDDYIRGKKLAFESKETPPIDYRALIIKDDYLNLADKYYGNNDIMGPDPSHGTHVSGLIAAQRDNGVGVDGVAANASIMMLRVVPDGDEYDKDVALAIRYAVDNGAKIINMSFGKSFSPEKKWVDSAIRYAEQKDVLVLHSAGNEAINIDQKEVFPNPWLTPWGGTKAQNYITVGASSDPKITGSITADFSNFGKQTVDVFAPGVKIYSTMPGKTRYGNQQGTSMATPIVSGIAALIRGYYPELTAVQVKQIIEQSALQPEDMNYCFKPGQGELVALNSLCKTGGIVNAFNAVLAAERMKNAKTTTSKN